MHKTTFSSSTRLRTSFLSSLDKLISASQMAHGSTSAYKGSHCGKTVLSKFTAWSFFRNKSWDENVCLLVQTSFDDWLNSMSSTHVRSRRGCKILLNRARGPHERRHGVWAWLIASLEKKVNHMRVEHSKVNTFVPLFGNPITGFTLGDVTDFVY